MYIFTFVLFAGLSIYICDSAIVTNEEDQGKGIVLSVGDSLILQCNSTDNPSAKVTQWLKNGAQMNYNDSRAHKENSDNTLTIKSTLESDCGNYTCKVDYKEALIAVRSMVELAPVNNSRNIVQNQNIVLLCNVTQGTPAPTIQWLKNNCPLNLTGPRITVNTDTAQGIKGTSLLISDAQFEDQAEYTCIATNEISSAKNTILVRVKSKFLPCTNKHDVEKAKIEAGVYYAVIGASFSSVALILGVMFWLILEIRNGRIVVTMLNAGQTTTPTNTYP